MSDEPLRIVSGSPTDEETAAIAAVLTQVRLVDAASTLPLPSGAGPSGWARSARPMRSPLARGGYSG